jgi:tetratricopeptide (TPR) repeat protein
VLGHEVLLMMLVSAFVARSFDPRDEERIRPILGFLNTFRDVGFIWETAEPADVQSVSEKVREMIDSHDVFIGFFTRRYAAYDLRAKIGGAWNVLRGRLKPAVWSAPAWVLQESGYALKAKGQKKLILLREEGVETFGLQGDLEYIPFDANDPSAVFPKLNEMIHGLLAQAAGVEVRTTISDRRVQEQAVAEPSVAEPTDAPKADAEEQDMVICLFKMSEASKRGELENVDRSWGEGKKIIDSGKGEGFDELKWDCLYFRLRFEAGDASSLDQLKRLRVQNSSRPEAAAALAYCSENGEAFLEAGGLFLEAACLSEGDTRARRLLDAAGAFRMAEKYEQATKAMTEAIDVASNELQERIVSAQYDLLKDRGEQYFAFALAESALQQNSQFSVRFGLGLDYLREGRNELGLFHFKFLCDRNKKYAAALHNLALLYSKCKLPISAVEHYKMAIGLGETLASANLGYLYLDCGMAKEARDVVDSAMKVEGHVSDVEKCFAAIVERREGEGNKGSELLQQAAEERKFFVEMGRALETTIPSVDGCWKFPFGEMRLTATGSVLTGTAEVEREEGGLAALTASLLGGSPGRKIKRIDKYDLKGDLTGAVCEFELVRSSAPLSMPSLSDMAGPKTGFIIFAPEGGAASYAELTDRKFGKVEKLTRVGSRVD